MISLGILSLLTISYLSILFSGYYIGTYGAAVIALLNFIVVWGWLFIGWSSVNLLSISTLWSWISIGSENTINFEFRFDEYTFGMYLVVLTVSFLVHIYSIVYMYADPFLSRFISYLTLFTLFMLILVSANNFIVLFLGWEGVGVCSYLLISFWFTRAQAAKAATKAFIANKVGDVFLLLGAAILFAWLGTVNFSDIFSLLWYTEHPISGVLVFCLFVGVIGKSAQIGLHTWLPDAMEGPTPVSALIHAATMVTAGVFLMVRASTIFEYSSEFLFVVASWGVFTALFSGIIGLAQTDIKKIIAYSTCSQLGFMVSACGFSHYNLAFFHLFNHAFFKALLFLSAGSVIHILLGEQDTRRMGGLAKLSPLVYIYVMIGSLSLMGVSFLSGFYSKDAIIEVAAVELLFGSEINFWVLLVSALLTAAYSVKLILNAFIISNNSQKQIIVQEQGLTLIEGVILGILCIGGIISGYLFKDMFIGFGSALFDLASVGVGGLLTGIDPELILPFIKGLPLIGSILIGSIYIFLMLSKTNYIKLNMSVIETYRFYYNEVINVYLSLPILNFARYSFEQWEKNILEGYGPVAVVQMISPILNKQYHGTSN